MSAVTKSGSSAAYSFLTASLIRVLSSFTSCKAVYRSGLCRQDDMVVFDDDQQMHEVTELCTRVPVCGGEGLVALLSKGCTRALLQAVLSRPSGLLAMRDGMVGPVAVAEFQEF